MSSSPDDPSLSEWDKARDVLNAFDERLHDLRKYGFSVIAGLLTIDALISSDWKLAALLSTLFLIVALNLVDRNYRVYLMAASIRAQIIERRSRMDLTQAITRIHESAHVNFLFQSLYVIFILATLLLGWIIFGSPTSSYYLSVLVTFASVLFFVSWVFFWPRTSRKHDSGNGKDNARGGWNIISYFDAYVLVGIISGLVSVFFGWLTFLIHPEWVSLLTHFDIFSFLSFCLSFLQVKSLHYRVTLLVMTTLAFLAVVLIEKGVNIQEWVDFVIDGYKYQEGEKILAMVSNLGSKHFKIDGLSVFAIYEEDDNPPHVPPIRYGPIETTKPLIDLPAQSKIAGRVGWSDYRRLIPTTGKRPGLYRLVYKGPVYVVKFGGLLKFYSLLNPAVETEHKKLEDIGYSCWNDAQRFMIVQKTKPSTQDLEKRNDDDAALVAWVLR